jgi:DNA-binding NarL/FixJ family response regulator
VIGTCLGAVLSAHGCNVTVRESFGRSSHAPPEAPPETFELLIVTNTCLPPSQIQRLVPRIKARHPLARLIVLSGYCPDDFVADLMRKGIDGFLPLPFEQGALLKEVDRSPSMPPPDRGNFPRGA